MSENKNYHQLIINYIDLVKKKSKDCKYFYFEDDSSKFVVDGNKLRLLPIEYHNLYNKDEFYVQVSPLEKKICYYAFDVEAFGNSKKINEKQGFMDWDQLETCIYNFFALNIKELSNSMTPHVEVSKSRPETVHSSSFSSESSNSSPNHNGYGNNYGSSYYGATYKEREAFYDKLWAFIKDNKTTMAMDHIGDHIQKMCDENKFDDLDSLIRMISFDKLNVPTMLGILNATQDVNHTLKARPDFYSKVKTHIAKVKPTRVGIMLRKFESISDQK